MAVTWAPLLALDPGGTTGWSTICVAPDALVEPKVLILESIMHWAQGEIVGGPDRQVDEILSLLDAWPETPLLSERFVLRKFLQDDTLLIPHDIQFLLGYVCRRGVGYLRNGKPAASARAGADAPPPERPFYLQQPAEAMATATNERLKDWGLYLANDQPHARDATRHAITLLRKAKAKPALRAELWPSLYGS